MVREIATDRANVGRVTVAGMFGLGVDEEKVVEVVRRIEFGVMVVA